MSPVERDDASTARGVDHAGWGTSAAFFDRDKDGFLDLFVCNYLSWQPNYELSCFNRTGTTDYCSPQSYQAPANDVLYANLGDGSFAEVNDRDRPYEGGAEGAMNLPDIGVFAEAAGMKEKEEKKEEVLEPLPEIPGMPMTVDQAYEFLGVKEGDRGNLDKVRGRTRAANAAAARARTTSTRARAALRSTPWVGAGQFFSRPASLTWKLLFRMPPHTGCAVRRRRRLAARRVAGARERGSPEQERGAWRRRRSRRRRCVLRRRLPCARRVCRFPP